MTNITKFADENALRVALATDYKKAIDNYFGDERRSREFLTNVVDSVRRIPELLNCTPATVLEAFMKMAQLKLMPSGVSGEAYVLPYRNHGVLEAQFQLGYQGIVTLLYRAGARSVVAEIVYAKDTFKWENGRIEHKADPFMADRGNAVGAYVVVELQGGGEVHKAMGKDAILEIAKRFSKSYGGKFTPWDEQNDPQLWMWKKTVLKQAAKTMPKNEALNLAIAADNEDSNIGDRMERARADSEGLSMGALAINGHEKENDQAGAGTKAQKSAKVADESTGAGSADE